MLFEAVHGMISKKLILLPLMWLETVIVVMNCFRLFLTKVHEVLELFKGSATSLLELRLVIDIFETPIEKTKTWLDVL